MFDTIKAKAKQLKKQIIIVYLAYMHKDVNWYKKAFLLLILIYALSPVDLIPDFIPILGMLDDVIIIPLGIILAMKLIPQFVWEECKQLAEQGVQIEKKYKVIGLFLILMIWVLGIYFVLKILIN